MADIYEEGGDIVVKAEIPGMKKDEIHVDINEKTITVSGEKRWPSSDGGTP